VTAELKIVTISSGCDFCLLCTKFIAGMHAVATAKITNNINAFFILLTLTFWLIFGIIY
jgi:hypothetical protein